MNPTGRLYNPGPALQNVPVRDYGHGAHHARIAQREDSPYRDETPVCLSCTDPGRIFVFGSNLSGWHGAGAAKHACDRHGAKYGQGVGFQGYSYAIPTKSHGITHTLPLLDIAGYAETFIQFAEEHQELRFFLTKIGCGLAGLRQEDVAPLFADCPLNVIRPEGW